MIQIYYIRDKILAQLGRDTVGRPSGEQLYQNLYANKVRWADLSNSDKMAVKNYITFKKQKTFSTEQPLQATREGQAQLAKVASVPVVPTPKPVSQPKRELTYGERLNQALTEQFPQAYPAVKETLGTAGKNIMANPAIGVPVSLLGAGATSLQDVLAEAFDPTSRKTIGQTLGKQVQNVQQGATDFLKSRAVSEPTLGGFLGAVSPQTAAGTVQAGLGKMSEQARPALDITRGIYEQSAMATRGLTPEQAKAESAAWVARNPNLAGTSSNILGAVLDPLNVPVAGIASKVGKGVEVLGGAIKKTPTPPQQVATTQPPSVSRPTLVDTPEGLRVVQPEPLPQPTVRTEPQQAVPVPTSVPTPKKVVAKRVKKAEPQPEPQIVSQIAEDLAPAPQVQVQPQPQPKLEPVAQPQVVEVPKEKVKPPTKQKEKPAPKTPVVEKIQEDLTPAPVQPLKPTSTPELTVVEEKASVETPTAKKTIELVKEQQPAKQVWKPLLDKIKSPEIANLIQEIALREVGTLVKSGMKKGDEFRKGVFDFTEDGASAFLTRRQKLIDDVAGALGNGASEADVLAQLKAVNKDLFNKSTLSPNADQIRGLVKERKIVAREVDEEAPTTSTVAEKIGKTLKPKVTQPAPSKVSTKAEKKVISDEAKLADYEKREASGKPEKPLVDPKQKGADGFSPNLLEAINDGMSRFGLDLSDYFGEDLYAPIVKGYKKDYENQYVDFNSIADANRYYRIFEQGSLNDEKYFIHQEGKRVYMFPRDGKQIESAFKSSFKDEIVEAKRQGKPAPKVPFSVRMKEKEKQPVGQSINDTLQAENDKRDLSKKMSQGIVSGVLPSKAPKGRMKSNVESVEKLLTTSTDQGLIQNIKNKLADLKEQFSGENFKDLFRAYNGTSNDIREDLFEGERKIARSAQEAEQTILEITRPLKNERDMELFERIVVLRDAKATLDASDIEDVPMPYNLTEADIASELKRYEDMAKNNQEVQDAIKNYQNTMRLIFDDLVRRGLVPEGSRREDYFPHRVVEYASRIKYGAGAPLDTPFRGYTKARKGTTKAYYTDFAGVMRDVLTKYYTDNYIADTTAKILSKADMLKKLTRADINTMLGARNLYKAQQASIPDVTKSGWIAGRTKELVDKGVDAKVAKAQAKAEWVPHERSVRAKFLAKQFVKLKKAGVPKENRAKLAQEAWRNSVEQPPITMQLLDNKTVYTHDGQRYKFFSPKGSNEIYLIPEKLDRIMEEFGQPLIDNAALQVGSDFTRFFKTSALTITLPARLVIDAVSNATKLSLMDTEALKYIPRAMRLMVRTSSAQNVRWLRSLVEAGLKNDTKNLDDATLAFAKQHEIIEPQESVKGVFAFTPVWKKILRYAFDPRVWAIGSRNLTQRTDEFFKLVKASADFDRIQNGGYANSAGIIDVEDLDKYGQTSKIAQEFFVNPMRQSRFMRKYFTQLLMPFLNWPAIDTLHAFRYLKNNPKRAALQAGVLIGGLQAWNNTGERRKLEEMLPPDRRQIPHFITGYKNADGKPIILYLPIFPGTTGLTSLGLAKVPQNITDALVPSTIPSQEKKKAQDILKPSEMFEAGAKTVTGMLNPVPRTFFELAANKSFYTELPIISRSEIGTYKGIADRLEYTLNQLAPPYRAYAGAQRTAETAELEGKDALYTALANTFSPIKRIVKPEDMKKLADEGLKRLEEQRTVTKNNAYQTILNLMPAAIATNDFDAIAKVVQEAGITKRQRQSYIQAHEVEILRKAILMTKDPARRKELQTVLDNLSKKRTTDAAKRAGAEQFEQAQYFMNIRNEGE